MLNLGEYLMRTVITPSVKSGIALQMQAKGRQTCVKQEKKESEGRGLTSSHGLIHSCDWRTKCHASHE